MFLLLLLYIVIHSKLLNFTALVWYHALCISPIEFTVVSSISAVTSVLCISAVVCSYQSECGSISEHSNHSVNTTTADGRRVAEEESFDVYCDYSVTEESLSHVSLSVITSNVLYLMDNMLL